MGGGGGVQIRVPEMFGEDFSLVVLSSRSRGVAGRYISVSVLASSDLDFFFFSAEGHRRRRLMFLFRHPGTN